LEGTQIKLEEHSVRRQILSKAFQIFDITLVVCALLTATSISLHQRNANWSVARLLEMRVSVSHLLAFGVMLLSWHLVFESLHLHGSKRLSRAWKEIVDVIRATTLGTLVIASFLVLLHASLLTPSFVIAFWVLSTALTVFSRLSLRKALSAIRSRGWNSRNMIIVGANKRALEFARTVQKSPELGYRVMGFADRPDFNPDELVNSDFAVVCDLHSLPNFVRTNVVDEVILALPMRSFYSYASEVATQCEQQGIIVRSITNLFDMKVGRTRTDEFDGTYVITHSLSMVDDSWGMIIKRVLDFVLSLTLLIVMAPLLVLVGLAIKLSSPGPVLFVQDRLGLSKRKFRMYKFRTMSVNAEEMLSKIEHLNEVAGPVFKIRNDPRITKVGKFLRKTSLDELPQLFNVLAGDMSLVGPRPLAVRDYTLMTQVCEDWQRCRFSVKPGVTCLWQVNGRNSIPFQKWMELDMEYIQNWSLWLDVRILLRTIPVVLRGSGA
jgi:exopolysaccharide biosynthesis polyprenyl glycosylphosphotransferase